MTATRHDDPPQRWQAVHARTLRLAQRLRDTSVIFRRYAGELKYHPQTGIQGHIGQDLLDAAATMRDVLDEVEALARQWSEEIAWLRSQNSRMPMEDVHQGHTAVRAAIRLVRTALDVFSRAALHPEHASLDAPYGHGAPRQVHPGAQCTWVAERAEKLAVELASVTLRKENLLLTQPH